MKTAQPYASQAAPCVFEVMSATHRDGTRVAVSFAPRTNSYQVSGAGHTRHFTDEGTAHREAWGRIARGAREAVA